MQRPLSTSPQILTPQTLQSFIATLCNLIGIVVAHVVYAYFQEVTDTFVSKGACWNSNVRHSSNKDYYIAYTLVPVVYDICSHMIPD